MTVTSRLRRPLFALSLLLLVAAASVAVFGWREYRSFADRPLELDPTQPAVVELQPGEGFRQLLRRLRAVGIDDGHDLMWHALVRELGLTTRLQVGEYAIEPGMTPRQVLGRIGRGEVIQYRFTIIEGWNFRELRDALARNEVLQRSIDALTDDELMRAVGADGLAPEGRFLPETYQFSRGTSDLELLRRARQAMDAALVEAWQRRADGLPLRSADEALILASIIEKETGVAGERREIAGVFVRRLKLGMRLQTDPTVIYGIGADFDGNLTRAHLQADTPWNTYVRGGLPPTPIAMPGRAAIEAAVDPAPGDTLYFVARGDGSHVFSRSLDEHNRAVRRYQLGLR